MRWLTRSSGPPEPSGATPRSALRLGRGRVRVRSHHAWRRRQPDRDGGHQRRFEYLLCPMLVAEIIAVMRRPKIVRVVSQEDSQRFLDDALAGGRDVGDPPEIVSHRRDPDDDYLFALAAHHHADWVVTGDTDLLVVTEPPVPVIRLREFLSLLTVDPS